MVWFHLSEDLEPSHVLAAMGLPTGDIGGTLRISIGTPTTTTEVDELLKILPAIIEQAKLN